MGSHGRARACYPHAHTGRQPKNEFNNVCEREREDFRSLMNNSGLSYQGTRSVGTRPQLQRQQLPKGEKKEIQLVTIITSCSWCLARLYTILRYSTLVKSTKRKCKAFTFAADKSARSRDSIQVKLHCGSRSHLSIKNLIT